MSHLMTRVHYIITNPLIQWSPEVKKIIAFEVRNHWLIELGIVTMMTMMMFGLVQGKGFSKKKNRSMQQHIRFSCQNGQWLLNMKIEILILNDCGRQSLQNAKLITNHANCRMLCRQEQYLILWQWNRVLIIIL